MLTKLSLSRLVFPLLMLRCCEIVATGELTVKLCCSCNRKQACGAKTSIDENAKTPKRPAKQ